MITTSAYNSKYSQMNFAAIPNKARKKELRGLVKDFCKNNNFKKDLETRNAFGRIWHPLIILQSAYNTVSCASLVNFAFGTWGVFINLGLDKMFHNIALRKSLVLRKSLQKQGIKDPDEMSYAISSYLGKKGGLLYSNAFRLFRKAKIQKIASDGELPKLDGIMYKLQVKFGGQTIGKAAEAKRKPLGFVGKVYAMGVDFLSKKLPQAD